MKGILICLLACTFIVGGLADIMCLAPQGSMDLYLQGVWDQLALEFDWKDFKSQIDMNSSLDDANMNLTNQGFTDLNINASNNNGQGSNQGPSDADIMVRGIQEVTQVLNQRFSLAGGNNFLGDYNLVLLQNIFADFTNQTGGTFTPQTSIIIQGVQVWDHIKEAIDNWNNASYYNAGMHLGMAIGMVFWRAQATTQAMADAINANQSDWVAQTYPFPSNTTLWNLKTLILNSHEPYWADYTNATTTLTPPTSYDLRNISNCIRPPRDVGKCGSSWAMGAHDSLADRFCLATNGVVDQILSTDYMMSCSGYNNGCQGGWNDRAWNFLESAGDASETCRPYTDAESNGTWSNNCSAASQCQDGSNAAKYYAQVNSSKWFWGSASIKAEIWAHGSVETSFSVYEDFIHYKSGIYHHVTGNYVGITSARLIGWGQDANGTNYWIAANYWGTNWGENGYFRMKENDGEWIEYAAVAGIPDLRSCAQQ